MANSYTQVLENLLACQMLLRDNLDTATIKFFRSIYPHLIILRQMNTNQMADAVGYTQQAAAEHREVLEKKGYITRIDYRNWQLNVDALTHPLLMVVLDLNVQVTKEGNKYYATKVTSKPKENENGMLMSQTA